MPVDPVEFNTLKLLVDSMNVRLDVVEDDLDKTEEGSIKDRVSDLESTVAAINQITALKQSLEDDINANKDEINSIGTEVNSLRNLYRTLNRWRTDIRHEMIYEKATGDAPKTTWTLSEFYDSTSLFVVFQANLTLVDPSLITFSSPLILKQFTSSVALTDDVHVIYFKALPSGT